MPWVVLRVRGEVGARARARARARVGVHAGAQDAEFEDQHWKRMSLRSNERRDQHQGP